MKNTNTPGIPPRHAAAAGGFRDKATRRTPGIPPHGKEAAAVDLERKRGKIPVRQTMTIERKQNEGEDINESAEAFIKNFRQELLRQRLESDHRRHESKKLARGL